MRHRMAIRKVRARRRYRARLWLQWLVAIVGLAYAPALIKLGALLLTVLLLLS